MASTLRPRSSVTAVTMHVEYDAQPRYDAHQSYDPRYDQQSYDAQRNNDQTNIQDTYVSAPGAQVAWSLTGSSGVRGFFDVAGVSGGQAVSASNVYDWFESDLTINQQVKEMAADVSAMGGSAGSIYEQDYRFLPYILNNGQVQVLSRWNMARQKLTVSRVQCKVQVSADGTATLTSCGKGPTLWRAWGGRWVGLDSGERQVLAGGDQVSLDCQDPEAAVFTCQVDTQSDYPQSLPAGWTTGVDQRSGATYYYHEQTGRSQWEPPVQHEGSYSDLANLGDMCI